MWWYMVSSEMHKTKMASSGNQEASPVVILEEMVEIKASPDEVFKVLSDEHHHIPVAASDHIQEITVHEGDGKTSGSVKVWKYTVDGKAEVFKESMEIDEANKAVTLTCLDGHALELYASLRNTFKVIHAEEGGGFVKITQEYGEKLNATDATCAAYMAVVINMIRDIDAHLLKK